MSEIDEAVEAAAKTMHRQECHVRDCDSWQGLYLDRARAAITAAAPILQRRRTAEQIAANRQRLSEYRDQPLCQCCGKDAAGNHYPHCTDLGIFHEESCAMFRWARDLCAGCDASFAVPERGTE